MKKSMSVPKFFLIILLIFGLLNLIGWLTKPDNYRPQYSEPTNDPIKEWLRSAQE